MEGTVGSIYPQAEININKKINGKTQKLANACDIVRKALQKNTQKVMSVFVRVSNKNVSQIVLGSHRPHGTGVT
jgi:hypothetical protein